MTIDAGTGAGPSGEDLTFRHIDERCWTNRAMLRAGEVLRVYHRHQVRGMEHLRSALASDRPVVLVGNHCLDIVDPLMLAVAVYRELGHVLRFIAHANVFTVPILRSLARDWGVIPNRQMALAERALRADGALMLYPGSGTEALMRSYRREPYLLKWRGRLGFVELAARHDARVLFVAGVGIDELYYQTEVPAPAVWRRFCTNGDEAYYRGACLQLGLAGLHLLPGVLPLPVRVTHVISPLGLPRGLDIADRGALEAAQVALSAEAQALLDRAVAGRTRHTDWLDASCRAALRALERTGL